MIQKNPIHDVIERTMYNLRFIEKHSNVEGPYEVTQLINSFLGAMAHPWEKVKKNIRHMTLNKAQQKGG